MIKVILRNQRLILESKGTLGYAEDIFENIQLANEWIAKMKDTKIFMEAVEEIIDLSEDINYMNNYVHKKRKEEYPDTAESFEAIFEYFEDRPEKLTELLMKRSEIKQKYPLIIIDPNGKPK